MILKKGVFTELETKLRKKRILRKAIFFGVGPVLSG